VREHLVLVARDDALYDYTPDTRAGCTAFDGKKRLLLGLRRYLVVVRGLEAVLVHFTRLHLDWCRGSSCSGAHCTQLHWGWCGGLELL
jgi:hypothetical protein